MKKKNTVRIIIGVGVAVISFIVVLLIIKTKKVDKIMLGMTGDEAISILDKNNYNYSVNRIDKVIHVEDVSVNNVKGSLNICLDSYNKIYWIAFSSDFSDLDKKIRKLNKYVDKMYGEPNHVYEGELNTDKYWEKDDMKISFTYPTNEKSHINICLSWETANNE